MSDVHGRFDFTCTHPLKCELKWAYKGPSKDTLLLLNATALTFGRPSEESIVPIQSSCIRAALGFDNARYILVEVH